MSTRIGIVLLVIIVVIFAALAGLGLTRDDNQSVADSPGWTDFLGDKLTMKQPLDTNDIGATVPSTCRQQIQQEMIVLSPGSKCTFIILESSSWLPKVRVLSLSLVEGPGAQVVLSQKDRLTVKENLSSGEAKKEFNVYNEGGTVSISCENSGDTPCQLRLGDAGASDTR